MAKVGNREIGGLVGKAITKLEETTGLTTVPTERIELLEAYYEDYRVLSRQLDTIGYNVLNYMGGQPQEYAPHARLRIVQQARFVHQNDPQAGASVELMNDFCFGRGIPKPRAKDKAVQKEIDDAWDDPDNQEILTTIDAQLALGSELSLTSNLFMLVFGLDRENEPDGKIKLSMLRHDDVYGYVPHPDKRHRVLYYLAKEIPQIWDYRTHQMKPLEVSAYTVDPTYYEHWRNVDLTKEEDTADGDTPVEYAPDQLIGKGRVYHVRINRTTEQQFGIPRFQRTLTWYSAYNKYVKDRLDIVAAAASLIMKRKIQGTPEQLMRDAAKAISRDSPLALSADPAGPLAAPRGVAGIVEENQAVQHEAFNLDTRAGNAMQDAQIIRAPISAAERWSQAYYGDASNSNLATATSLELPILKAVESRQEVFERLIRFFVDQVIQAAVDAGRISKELEPEEMPVVTPDAVDPDTTAISMTQSLEEAIKHELDEGREVVEVARVTPRPIKGVEPLRRDEVILLVSCDESGADYHYSVLESYEDQTDDEVSTERDLSYEFSMPSPLRRMMADLITAVTTIAQTFDPNNTNPKLARILLTVALGEGLEVQDAPDLVDIAIPEGYVDPLVKAQLDAGAAPQGQGADAYSNADNPYGAPMSSTMPEDQRSGAYNAQEAEFVETGRTRGRDGSVVIWTRRRQLREAIKDQPEPRRRQVEGDRDEAAADFSADVIGQALDGLDRESGLLSGNGNGRTH